MKIPTGKFTYKEYYEIVRKWRGRYVSNKCGRYPHPDRLVFLGNRKVICLEDGVRLEAIT